MNDTTWVKLYRKSLSNDVRRHDPTAWRLFETLLLLVDSNTGIWSGGIYQLTEADGSLNSNTIYKALIRLEKNGMIIKKSKTRYSEIYICKFIELHKSGNTSRQMTGESQANQGKTLTRSKEVRSKNIVTSSSNELNDTHEWICELFEKSSTRYKMTDQRKQKLKSRVGELGEARVKGAFEAVAASNWHRGANDRGWRVDDDPYWVLANLERTEKWANIHDEGDAPIKRNQTDLSKVEIPLS